MPQVVSSNPSSERDRTAYQSMLLSNLDQNIQRNLTRKNLVSNAVNTIEEEMRRNPDKFKGAKATIDTTGRLTGNKAYNDAFKRKGKALERTGESRFDAKIEEATDETKALLSTAINDVNKGNAAGRAVESIVSGEDPHPSGNYFRYPDEKSVSVDNLRDKVSESANRAFDKTQENRRERLQESADIIGLNPQTETVENGTTTTTATPSNDSAAGVKKYLSDAATTGQSLRQGYSQSHQVDIDSGTAPKIKYSDTITAKQVDEGEVTDEIRESYEDLMMHARVKDAMNMFTGQTTNRYADMAEERAKLAERYDKAARKESGVVHQGGVEYEAGSKGKISLRTATGEHAAASNEFIITNKVGNATSGAGKKDPLPPTMTGYNLGGTAIEVIPTEEKNKLGQTLYNFGSGAATVIPIPEDLQNNIARVFERGLRGRSPKKGDVIEREGIKGEVRSYNPDETSEWNTQIVYSDEYGNRDIIMHINVDKNGKITLPDKNVHIGRDNRLTQTFYSQLKGATKTAQTATNAPKDQQDVYNRKVIEQTIP